MKLKRRDVIGAGCWSSCSSGWSPCSCWRAWDPAGARSPTRPHIGPSRRLCSRRPAGTGHGARGFAAMQSARPRDYGALALVIALFLVLLVVSLALGSPAVR